jgi:hypothetical protein
MRPGTRIVLLCVIVLAVQGAWLLSRIPSADAHRAPPGTDRLDTLAERIGSYARMAGGLPRDIDALMCSRQFSDASSEGYLVDAYGAPIRYQVTGASTFRLSSFGADREPGGADVFEDRAREYDVDSPRY